MGNFMGSFAFSIAGIFADGSMGTFTGSFIVNLQQAFPA
jgi:hypothetical protein